MKCQFCPGQECYVDADVNISNSKIGWYECLNCGASYQAAADDETLILCVCWAIHWGEEEYFIKCYDSCTGNAPRFVVFHLITDEDRNHYWRVVHRFDFIPDWTPQNSATKLKAYLPFL